MSLVHYRTMNQDRLIEEIEDNTHFLGFKLGMIFKEIVSANIDYMNIHYIESRNLRKKVCSYLNAR
jgi:hypothetical protein